VDFKNLGKREMRLLAALRTGSAVIFTEGHGKKRKATSTTCPLLASALVWSYRLSHAFIRNVGSTQKTTCTMSCLVSRLVDSI
jgi:hypothetical protein